MSLVVCLFVYVVCVCVCVCVFKNRIHQAVYVYIKYTQQFLA